MNKIKLLNLGLILSSLIGYLEWGEDQHMFLFQGELDVIGKVFTDPGSIAHPFIVLPMIGQILLLVTLFQHKPGKVLSLTGMACIAVLLVFISFVGFISLNLKIAVATVPFIACAVAQIIALRKSGKTK